MLDFEFTEDSITGIVLKAGMISDFFIIARFSSVSLVLDLIVG
jgi:hypothetical protein